MRLLDPQHDEAEHGDKVKGVAGDAVKGDEGAELAHDAVARREHRVEEQRVDGSEEEARVLVAEAGAKLFGQPAARALRRQAVVAVKAAAAAADAQPAKDVRDVALLAGHVDEATGRECGRVEGAKAARADNERKDERAGGAKDLGPEHDGDGVGRVDGRQG